MAKYINFFTAQNKKASTGLGATCVAKCINPNMSQKTFCGWIRLGVKISRLLRRAGTMCKPWTPSRIGSGNRNASFSNEWLTLMFPGWKLHGGIDFTNTNEGKPYTEGQNKTTATNIFTVGEGTCLQHGSWETSYLMNQRIWMDLVPLYCYYTAIEFVLLTSKILRFVPWKRIKKRIKKTQGPTRHRHLPLWRRSLLVGVRTDGRFFRCLRGFLSQVL